MFGNLRFKVICYFWIFSIFNVFVRVSIERQTMDDPAGLSRQESLLWPGASQWRIYYHRIWVQLSTTFSNVLKQPNGVLLVAVNNNQLRTMAPETVDPIDWSHPPPSWTVPPERHVHSIKQSNLSGARTCNRSMQSNHLAYAATQGIMKSY